MERAKNIIEDKGHLRRNFKTRGNVTTERKPLNIGANRYGRQKIYADIAWL